MFRDRLVAGATVDDDWRFTKVYLRRASRWQVVRQLQVAQYEPAAVARI